MSKLLVQYEPPATSETKKIQREKKFKYVKFWKKKLHLRFYLAVTLLKNLPVINVCLYLRTQI